MGISERKEKEKQIRRNDIIDAAEKVIFLKGYDSATIEEIAREAEFSKRTVYIYFNSKEQIYFEIMVRGYKILIKLVESYLEKADSQDSLSRIKEIGNAIYAFNKEYPDYFKAIMSYENGEKDFVNGVPDESREECYALGEKLLCYLVSELEKGKKEGTVRCDIDVTSTAILLWSFVIGLFNTLTKKKNYVEYYHKRRPDELLKEGFSFLLTSIKNDNRGEKNELE